MNDYHKHEYLGLNSDFNLSDSHAHHFPNKRQKRIIESLPLIWKQTSKKSQKEIEDDFLPIYYRAKKQESGLKHNTSLLTYSALTSLAIMADYLQKNKISVSLLQPTFYKLHNVLINSGVQVHGFDESILLDTDNLEKNLKTLKGKAIFLVDVNNPTGQSFYGLGKAWYEKLIQFAKKNNKILIFDFCFNWFDPARFDVKKRFDMYKLLDSSGVDYMAMEDYEKIFPLEETKVSIIKTSQSLFQDIYKIQSGYLLNTSPFTLLLASKFLEDFYTNDGINEVYELVDKNKALLAKILLKHPSLKIRPSNSKASVAWIEILTSKINSDELMLFLEENDLFVVSGTHYFFKEKDKGKKLFRVACMRDEKKFAKAMKKFDALLGEFDL